MCSLSTFFTIGGTDTSVIGLGLVDDNNVDEDGNGECDNDSNERCGIDGD